MGHDDEASWWLLPAAALLRGAGARRAEGPAWDAARVRLGAWLRRADARDAARDAPRPLRPPAASGVPGAPMCPSAAPRPGAWLLGRVAVDGSMRWAPQARRLGADADALETPAGRQGVRVAAPCDGARCGYWHDGRCRLIDAVLEAVPSGSAGAVGDCAIRDECRWRLQHGDAACAVCPGITRGLWDRA